MTCESPAGAAPNAARAAPRIVLDTNVCLDLLLFGDPRCQVLRAALLDSAVHAVTDEACRGEWLRVLCYPQLALGEARRAALREAFDSLTHRLDWHASPAELDRLPRCSDRDDQKFMELAAISGARWLLSRDQALLTLGRRTRAAGLFAIATPQDWRFAASDP